MSLTGSDQHNLANDVEVLIIGAGIAGLSAALFCADSGRTPLVIDAGIDTASAVPTALINPVRGYTGKVVHRGVQGARFTFDLINRLAAKGHRIIFGRGLWRPIPDAPTRERWQAQLPQGFPVQWQDDLPAGIVLRGNWMGGLQISDSGWVQTDSLLDALRTESNVSVVRACVTGMDVTSGKVMLDDGRELRARHLLWCGGAWGAARLGVRATFRPGGMFLTDVPVSKLAISYGLYAAPCEEGSAIGPTTEPLFRNYPGAATRPEVMDSLVARAREMFAQPFNVRAQWRGVRLDSLQAPPDFPVLTRFGSGGYLLAPLAAAEWAASIPR